VKQDFKEHIFEVSFDQQVLPEHTAIHLFDLIKANEKSILIKRREDFSNNDILQFFMHKGLNIRSFNEVLPSLNDIFIQLVEGSPEARQFNN
jgi:ABC-2 type transport system ATP-binding protein